MKKSRIIYHFANYSLSEDITAFLPHKLYPYQGEKRLPNGDYLETYFQNGRMYQITKSKSCEETLKELEIT